MAKHRRRRQFRWEPSRVDRVLGLACGGVAAAVALTALAPAVGPLDSALAGVELAAEPTTPTTRPLADEWFDSATSTTSPSSTVPALPIAPSTSTTAAPVTTSTVPDPTAGLARYDVSIGGWSGQGFRLSDVEPGRRGVAVLGCACDPAAGVEIGDAVAVDGRRWEVTRMGSVPVSGLHEVLVGAPVVPVVRVVSSLDGPTRAWIEVR